MQDIWRLLELRGVKPFVKQVGVRKDQVRSKGNHCLCRAKDEEVLWIACSNFETGECDHATGWFHPRCVGLAHLKTDKDVEDAGEWQCPCCVSEEARKSYRTYSSHSFLRPSSAGDEESGSDSEISDDLLMDQHNIPGGGPALDLGDDDSDTEDEDSYPDD